jgi:hypothetical protein
VYVVLTVVFPEDTGKPDRGPRSLGSLGLVVGLALVAGGAVAIGNLTEPAQVSPNTTFAATPTLAPPSEPTTTLPFSVESIERGVQYEWAQVASLGERSLVTMIEHAGSIHAFSIDPDGRIETLVSTDGQEWASMGSDLADATVAGVISTPVGLLAYGMKDDSPMTWLSEDGLDWVPTPLPTEHTDGDVWFNDAITHRGRIILLGGEFPRYSDPVQEALEDRLGASITQYGWTTTESSPPGIAVHGPLGITIVSITLEDLGLTEEDLFPEVTDDSQTATVWSSSDGVVWERVTLRDANAGSMVVGPDDRIWAASYDIQNRWLVSDDGLTWLTNDDARAPFADYIQGWGDGYIGADYTGVNPALTLSDDLTNWTRVDIGFEDERGINWNYRIVTDGPDLVVLAEGWEDQPTSPVSAELQRGEYAFVYRAAGIIEIDDEQGVVARYSLWGPTVAPGVVPDLDNELISFHNPETSAHLMTLSFNEMTDLESSMWDVPRPPPHLALLRATDPALFSIQDLSDIVPDGSWIAGLHLADDRVVLAVTAETPAGTDLQIWTGTPDDSADVDGGTGHSG